MDPLRTRFWERPLGQLNRAEWEALCDGCGRCCLHKIEDYDTGEISDTNVACKLLDTQTARCTDYCNRVAFVPDCITLTPQNVPETAWLPQTCAYRLRAEGKPLADWHPLLSGNPNSVVEAGVSVAGRVICETKSGPIEHHIVDWGDSDRAAHD